MNRTRLLLASALGAFTLSAAAQNMPPVVTSQIANFTEYAGAPARSIDLASAFSDPDVSNAVRLTTVLGNIDIALFGQQKPITVTNFLKYVDQGRYFIFDSTTNQVASSFIHRSVPGFIIQGGGFIGTVDPNLTNNPSKDNVQATQVLAFAAIQNEPGISNKRGTIAMAQMSGNPNSATSQWFINLADNTNLDIQTNNNGVTAGPYTVFGRVVGNGMTVVDAIASVPRYNFGDPFAELPLRNFNPANRVKLPNLISLPAISQISPLTFSAMSDNGSVSVGVSGTKQCRHRARHRDRDRLRRRDGLATVHGERHRRSRPSRSTFDPHAGGHRRQRAHRRFHHAGLGVEAAGDPGDRTIERPEQCAHRPGFGIA
jgi:peptidyl-prolyl cis-trans isomerase A (cyclophilin A)